MTYYQLCQQLAQRFLDDAQTPEMLLSKLTEVTVTKSQQDEWDAEIQNQHMHLLYLL